MRKEQVFPSKYLKASDLHGEPLTVVIDAAPYEELTALDGKKESKVVLYFKGMKKCFPLNVTNFDSVVEVTGQEDSDGFPGHTLELFPWKTEMHGKMKDCIRIRAPEQPELSASAAATTPSKRAKRATVAAKPPRQDDDMDDDIPFLR